MPEFSKFTSLLKPHIPPDGVVVSEKNEVWLFDNTAFRASPTDEWQAEFVAAFFKHNAVGRARITAAITELLHILHLAAGDPITEERIRERVGPFMRSIGENLTVDVDYSATGQLHLGPSDGNGISSQVFTVPIVDPNTGKPPMPSPDGKPWTVKVQEKEAEAMAEASLTSTLESGRTYLAEDGGWGVFSDLDDTAKISCVNSHIKLLENTFINLPVFTDGSPAVYNGIRDAISTPTHPAPFFYISASPYNLYPFLRAFLEESGYPGGTIILRDMSWMDMQNWSITHKSEGVQQYKVDRFKKVNRWLPRTSWVCFGDSGQRDPEAYAEFYHYLMGLNQTNSAGGKVARIFIRKVVGVDLDKEKTLNAPERFEEAFKGIPKEVWRVYEHCGEIEDEIERIKADRLAAAAASGDTSVGAGGAGAGAATSTGDAAAAPPGADVTVKNGCGCVCL